ncbi:MAG TPA: hypothetical protein VGG34_11870 [Opitutaceae bacterium]
MAAGIACLSQRAYPEVVAIPGSDGTAAPTWSNIENDHYDQRAHFEAGADRLSAHLDYEIRVLRDHRAKMTRDLGDWDLAMKDVDESRDLLTSRITELKKATTPDLWDAAKGRFGDAWKRSQLAVDRMNRTVTD